MGKGNDRRNSTFRTFFKKAGNFVMNGFQLQKKREKEATAKEKAGRGRGRWGGNTIRIHCHRAETRYAKLLGRRR